MDECKELEIKNKQLMVENKELRMKNINVLNYKSWTWENIIQWILAIEQDRFVKYEKKLREVISQEQPSGDDLYDVNEGDIKRWGVTVFKDIKLLYKNIKKLTNKENGLER
eukprot:161832_1